jgi:hypothetical protein
MYATLYILETTNQITATSAALKGRSVTARAVIDGPYSSNHKDLAVTLCVFVSPWFLTFVA